MIFLYKQCYLSFLSTTIMFIIIIRGVTFQLRNFWSFTKYKIISRYNRTWVYRFFAIDVVAWTLWDFWARRDKTKVFVTRFGLWKFKTINSRTPKTNCHQKHLLLEFDVSQQFLKYALPSLSSTRQFWPLHTRFVLALKRSPVIVQKRSKNKTPKSMCRT